MNNITVNFVLFALSIYESKWSAFVLALSNKFSFDCTSYDLKKNELKLMINPTKFFNISVKIIADTL